MEAVEATASGLDVQKGQTLEDMSGMVHQLSMKIAERKSRLAPIIKELRPLRQWFLSVVMISWGGGGGYGLVVHWAKMKL